MIVRPLTPRDAARFADLAREASPGFDLATELEAPCSVVRAACLAPERPPLAYAVERWLPPEVELLALATLPEARRCGAARALVIDLLARAHRGGCTRVTLEVRAGNAAARGLYEGLGFQTFGIRKGYYRAGREDALLLELGLPASNAPR